MSRMFVSDDVHRHRCGDCDERSDSQGPSLHGPASETRHAAASPILWPMASFRRPQQLSHGQAHLFWVLTMAHRRQGPTPSHIASVQGAIPVVQPGHCVLTDRTRSRSVRGWPSAHSSTRSCPGRLGRPAARTNRRSGGDPLSTRCTRSCYVWCHDAQLTRGLGAGPAAAPGHPVTPGRRVPIGRTGGTGMHRWSPARCRRARCRRSVRRLLRNVLAEVGTRCTTIARTRRTRCWPVPGWRQRLRDASGSRISSRSGAVSGRRGRRSAQRTSRGGQL